MGYSVVVCSSMNRVHRYYIFRIIIRNFQEVAEFSLHSLIIGYKICYLKIHGFAILFGHKIYLAVWQQANRKLVSETFQV